MSAAQPSPHRPRAWLRIVLALGILCLEYLLLAVCFDGTELLGTPGLASVIAYSGVLVSVGSAGVTALLILGARPALAALRSFEPAPIQWRWAFVHLGAYAALFVLSALLFTRALPAMALLAAAWIASGLAVLLSLFRSLIGSHTLPLRRLSSVAALGLGLGWAISIVGWSSTAYWGRLTRATLSFAAWLLSLVSRSVRTDPDNAILALDQFSVEVGAACSGIEGMALIALFTLGYLLRFRAELRFPNALLLLPLGIGLGWIANGVRIAVLVLIGARLSPEIAFGGFHSKAGWIFFCALALGLAWLGQRVAWFSRTGPTSSERTDNPTAAYCVPLLVLIGLGMVTGAFAGVLDRFYFVRVLGGAAALFAYRSHYARQSGALSLAHAPNRALGAGMPVAIGAAVFCLWLPLHPPDASAAVVAAALPGLGEYAVVPWLALRVIGSVLVVPAAEELAFRGFLQRRLSAADFEQVGYRPLEPRAVLVSALAFGLLHSSVLGGALAGAAYSLAAARRGRLIDAVIAHATTNALICVWVLACGRWDLW